MYVDEKQLNILYSRYEFLWVGGDVFIQWADRRIKRLRGVFEMHFI